MSDRPIALTVDMPRPEKELSADFQALHTLFEQYPNDRPRVFTALAYFLGLLEIVEQISTKPVFSGPSHPAPRSRLDHLIESLPMALPRMPAPEIEQLRAIGLDFSRFYAGIADWILDSPENFRMSPVILEDFQEHPEGSELIQQAAQSNNEGDLKLAGGDLAGALNLYVEANRLLQGADYGEGHRIVWTNLIQTTVLLGQSSESLRWLREGVHAANYFEEGTAL